jgi:hypothetical protein
MRRSLHRHTSALLLGIAFSLVAAGAMAQIITQTATETVTQELPDWVGKLPFTLPAAAALLVHEPDDYTGGFQVKPSQFDPGKTYLVQAAWLHGIGCPTNARTVVINAAGTAIEEGPRTTDTACPVGQSDASDSRVEGLLLAKTGPQANFANATARVVGVKNQLITELGWDIRKWGPGSIFGASGSHCGGGAPRWNVQTDAGFLFIGCNSPVPPSIQFPGEAWIRMTWVFPVPVQVQSLAIVFDEGTDLGGPDFFGAAILDNININGVRVGRGATDAR